MRRILTGVRPCSASYSSAILPICLRRFALLMRVRWYSLEKLRLCMPNRPIISTCGCCLRAMLAGMSWACASAGRSDCADCGAGVSGCAAGSARLTAGLLGFLALQIVFDGGALLVHFIAKMQDLLDSAVSTVARSASSVGLPSKPPILGPPGSPNGCSGHELGGSGASPRVRDGVPRRRPCAAACAARPPRVARHA